MAQQILQCEPIDVFGGVGPVSVDLESLEVGDDEQRRILKVLAIVEKLPISCGREAAMVCACICNAKWPRFQTLG